MKPITPKTFPSIRNLNEMSMRAMEEHYKLYAGYVEKFNSLIAKFASTLEAGRSFEALDMQSVKVDITYALAAIKNHELFFDILGGKGGAPQGDLAKAIDQEFGGIERFIIDLRQTAMASRGWCWTAYDIDQGHIFNYAGSTQSAMPVWNAVPILGIDMYAHAYLYDFSNNRRGYVDAVLKNMDWDKVSARLVQAKKLQSVLG